MKLAFRAVLALATALGLFAGPVQATWSIVCVNLRTREVGVATATCLQGDNIRRYVPVITVGEGAAAAQHIVEMDGSNRRIIFLAFRDTEDTPDEILNQVLSGGGAAARRQFGIVNFTGPAAAFTGMQVSGRRAHVTGETGDFLYAIQGNSLTGAEVVFAAETAFLGTKGDMGQRMMAAMEAARALGGDGRCSCSVTAPGSCGAPPPDFTKSAHVGTVVVARVGDSDGPCGGAGCARGDYYLDLTYVGQNVDPDPVLALQDMYDAWRREHVNRVDGVLSRYKGPLPLPADGVTSGQVSLRLKDIEGNDLTGDGVRFEITALGAEGGGTGTTAGLVTSHGLGRYSFPVTAGTVPGVQRFRITALDGNVRATLYPELEVETLAPEGLFAQPRRLSAADGGELTLVLHDPRFWPRGAANDPRFWILGALADDGGARLDRVGHGTATNGHVLLPPTALKDGASFVLDANGRCELRLPVPAGLFTDLIGLRLDWHAVALRGGALTNMGQARTLIGP